MSQINLNNKNHVYISIYTHIRIFSSQSKSSFFTISLVHYEQNHLLHVNMTKVLYRKYLNLDLLEEKDIKIFALKIKLFF